MVTSADAAQLLLASDVFPNRVGSGIGNADNQLIDNTSI